MGRWYCCNDSFVSLSTLQDVLSEKVYILFFSRTNRRSANTASNGAKSCDCNGHEASKRPKPALQPKGSNGEVQDSVSLEKSEKAKISLINGDGLNRNKTSD